MKGRVGPEPLGFVGTVLRLDTVTITYSTVILYDTLQEMQQLYRFAFRDRVDSIK